MRALALLLVLAAACSPDRPPGEGAEEGAPVEPPFEVRGDCEGLLLVWFDDEGLHTASTRDEVPAGRRQRVRVDSLSAEPDLRLDPSLVYVADLRRPGEGNRYTVRVMSREAFDALVDRAGGRAPGDEGNGAQVATGPGAPGNADVIIYGASWCGACRSAAGFFRRRGVAFVERDIERDPSARTEMQQKARRVGMVPSGIPVIDVRGTLVQGFDERRITALLEAG